MNSLIANNVIEGSRSHGIWLIDAYKCIISNNHLGSSGSISRHTGHGICAEESPDALKAAWRKRGATYDNETTEINDSGANDVDVLHTSIDNNDTFYFGFSLLCKALKIQIGTRGAKGTSAWTGHWEYYNGTSWVGVPFIYQGIGNDFLEAAGTYELVFDLSLTNWKTSYIGQPILVRAYYIRWRIDTIIDKGDYTTPKITQAWALYGNRWVEIIGNEIDSSSLSGLYLNGTHASRNYVVKGNHITDFGRDTSGDAGMYLIGAYDSVIQGNVIEDAQQSHAGDGIILHADGCTVQGNNVVVRQSGKTAFRLYGNRNTITGNGLSGQNYGIWGLGNAKECTITGNILKGDTSGVRLSDTNDYIIVTNNICDGGVRMGTGTHNVEANNVALPNEGTFAPFLTSSHNRDYQISIPDLPLPAGKRISVPLNVDNAAGILAGEFSLNFNPSLLKPLNVSITTLTSGYVVAQQTRNGQLNIVFAGGKILSGAGALVNMEFEIIGSDDATVKNVLALSRIRLNEHQPVIKGIISEQPLKPTQTMLFQNYPNPSNPETWIPYQLSKDAEVIISIYNIKGQLVRTLHFGQKPAGLYTVKERAAYWNGCNQTGEKVSSGIYFYTIRAGNFKATRKMILVK